MDTREKVKTNGKILISPKRYDDSSSDSEGESEIDLVIDERDSTDVLNNQPPPTFDEVCSIRGQIPRSTIDCSVQFTPHEGASIVKKKDKVKTKCEFKCKFTKWDFLITICSTCIFFFDFIMDIIVAHEYSKHKRWVAFGFTAGFIIVPAVLSNGQSLRWYLIDYEREKKKSIQHPKTVRTPLYVWIFRIIFTFPLMMGPAVRHIEYIYHGIKYKSSKSYKEKKYHYKQMLYEDTDAALVRMFEAFLEAAPQLVLQLFIVITETPNEPFHKHMIRSAAMLGSWIGLSWSLVSYHRALRSMQHLKPTRKPTESNGQPDAQVDIPESQKEAAEEMKLPAVIFYFLWRASEVGPRLVVFALFASQFSYIILIVAGLHWLGMTLWLLCQKTHFYKDDHKHRRRDEVIFNIVLGYTMVFSFLNARDGRTRYRALVYYIVFYAENYVMLMMWVYWTPSKSEWYYFVAIAVVPAGTILHIVFQLFYYKVCHPKKHKIEICPK
ncbi:hypothetical protein FSP39_005814 [Pinctada imbricata]|uniref:XK-related protein n=1 Tax=Pinctada imbricata TaxID=66713 RepID=A0AA89BQ00_PINIB|nr:hypothetical protein FSP39_005814 [Pinctada imbricata]